MDRHDPWRRVRLGFLALALVTLAGTIGYLVLGLSLLDALYQTVTTVSTVGFREVGESTGAWKAFTMVLILVGAGTVLYTLTVTLETLIEGRVTDHFRSRRMVREIEQVSNHVVVCGWGRIGRRAADDLRAAGRDVVVIDRDDRVKQCPHLYVQGDATDDEVLAAAGLARASTLLAVVSNDSDNVYITLSGRAVQPDLFIVARARVESAEARLRQAGADRVVNPQAIGGARVAALTLQPHVVDFLDVVMHDGSIEFRLEEVEVPIGSPLVGRSIREAAIRDRTGALIMGIRAADGSFLPNPAPEHTIGVGEVLIGIGTPPQLAALCAEVSSTEAAGGEHQAVPRGGRAATDR
ncbi:MAG TPA: potassium channel protein [Acidimicrobiales bacterium]